MNPDAPAFAVEDHGLTCREYIATHLMAGYLAMFSGDGVTPPIPSDTARFCVERTDALIAELSKPRKETP